MLYKFINNLSERLSGFEYFLLLKPHESLQLFVNF